MKYLILFAMLLTINSCSPINYETEKSVQYSRIVGTTWYITGTQNNLDEYIFYRDSVIIWEYKYSPYTQVDQRTGTVYPQYRVMSIIKRKLEILDKDIPYKDGDGEYLYLHQYKGYTVADNGARPYDWATYSHIYFTRIESTEMEMGMYDEYKSVQEGWLFHSKPPLKLDFTGWN